METKTKNLANDNTLKLLKAKSIKIFYSDFYKHMKLFIQSWLEILMNFNYQGEKTGENNR